MNLDDESGNFFENAPDLPVSDRKWPHFISYSIDDQNTHEDFVNFGKRGVYAQPLSQSVNYGGGVPASLSRKDYEGLLDLLRNKT